MKNINDLVKSIILGASVVGMNSDAKSEEIPNAGVPDLKKDGIDNQLPQTTQLIFKKASDSDEFMLSAHTSHKSHSSHRSHKSHSSHYSHYSQSYS